MSQRSLCDSGEDGFPNGPLSQIINTSSSRKNQKAAKPVFMGNETGWVLGSGGHAQRGPRGAHVPCLLQAPTVPSLL